MTLAVRSRNPFEVSYYVILTVILVMLVWTQQLPSKSVLTGQTIKLESGTRASEDKSLLYSLRGTKLLRLRPLHVLDESLKYRRVSICWKEIA